MITLNKLAYDLLNIVRGGKISDDENLSIRQIKFWINNTRAQLIRQDLNKSRSVSRNLVQSLGCVDVESVDASLCCNLEVDCIVYRTAERIPNPIETNHKDLITRVGSVTMGTRAFQFIPYERAAYIGNSPFEGINNSIKAFLFDRYIYLLIPNDDTVMRKINIQGVFGDPTEVGDFNPCDGNECYTDDSYYPISEHMVETMKQMIITTNFKIAASASTDSKGDGKFEVEPNTPQQ